MQKALIPRFCHAQTRDANAYGHRNAGRSSIKVAVKTVTSKRELTILYNIWYQIS